MKRYLIFSFLFFWSTYSYSQIFVIGPTAHYNFSNGLNDFSWGIEFSYWRWEGLYYNDLPPLGMDIGLEFENSKKRIYSEIQTGILLGGSLGYVFEFGEDYKIGGMQASVWAAFYGGLELRYRRLPKENILAPGGFIKAPIYERYPEFFGNIFGNLI